MMALYHLGIDDTDSLKQGCTTYIGALLVERLIKTSKFIDYPNLIRLNPNIPWKSRGNAAICLRFMSDEDITEILSDAANLVEENRDKKDSKNQPGIAILGGQVPQIVKDLGRRALWDVVTPTEALDVALKANVKYELIRGGRGLVGALASIGNTLESDHTFELIAYRGRALWGKKREVDHESVLIFDRNTGSHTFNNIDVEEDRVLITPHGPDPILFGVRGDSPSVVMEALTKIKFIGGERWMVCRSNQGTGAHLIRSALIVELKPYQAAIIEGIISRSPYVLKGSHVIASMKDSSGEIDIAGYEPSGSFRNIVRNLLPGDKVRAFGGIRLLEGGKLTFNLERLELLGLITEKPANPICPNCKKSMKSEGKGKGYQCKKCGLKTELAVIKKINRKLMNGAYLPPPRAMRHLTKPFNRYGVEKQSWDGIVGTFYGVF
jgi:tRNA(Ile2)-agmatinylcytidine synthase